LKCSFKIIAFIVECINILLMSSDFVGVLSDLVSVESRIGNIIIVGLGEKGVFFRDTNLKLVLCGTLNESVSSSSASNNYPKSKP